ncbi:ABC transporter substrate-binding protein [Roseateles sp. DAIF2]|uniref:substrate-binding periplasmic protein n=1 Tax=Roseateles sp. DAIF2 TaxID=2714952 RepID=UPI0018A333AA|nr:transporter substrate-binding domain-containing protein [Roseateles sp. DAIF2]QPF75893.1 ABC transporter substrate-binding protein [Roseateles sp. DAIF2]
MAYPDAMPPIAYQDREPQHRLPQQPPPMRGAWVAVADELGRRLQLPPVEHAGYPWARAQLMVRTGRADGMITAVNPERLGYAVAGQEDVLENDTRIYVHKSNPRLAELTGVQRIGELQKYRVVSYLGNGWLKARLPADSVRWLRSLDDAVRMAALQPEMVLVEGERLLLPALRRRGLEDQFIPVGPVLERTSSRLLIGKQSPYAARIAEFDKALAAMRRDGTLKQIMVAHGLD